MIHEKLLSGSCILPRLTLLLGAQGFWGRKSPRDPLKRGGADGEAGEQGSPE